MDFIRGPYIFRLCLRSLRPDFPCTGTYNLLRLSARLWIPFIVRFVLSLSYPLKYSALLNFHLCARPQADSYTAFTHLNFIRVSCLASLLCRQMVMPNKLSKLLQLHSYGFEYFWRFFVVVAGGKLERPMEIVLLLWVDEAFVGEWNRNGRL